MAKRAIGYCRVSTADQAEHGLSLDAQRQKIEGYCTAHGLELLDVIVDPAVSGAKPLADREGGKKVLDSEADVVVAAKLDRLFRSTIDTLATTQQLHDAGKGVCMLDLGVDTTTSIGKLFMTITAAFAEFERNRIAERIKEALAYKKSQGKRIGSIPYGYRLEGDQIIEDADEQRAISRILVLRAKGLSYAQIAKSLERGGYEPRGEKWHRQTIARIVKNEHERNSQSGDSEE